MIFLQMKKNNKVFLAGQLSGVEGYIESAAMGLLGGLNSYSLLTGTPLNVPPPETAHGALIHHLTGTEPKYFQPSNVNFGLFPPIGKKLRKRDRGPFRADLALRALKDWQGSSKVFRG